MDLTSERFIRYYIFCTLFVDCSIAAYKNEIMNSILFTSLKKGFLGYNMFPTCYQLICELMKKPYSSYGKFLDQMAHFQSRHLSSSCVPLFSSCANVECINTCGRTSHVQCIHSFSQHDIILDPGNLRSNVPDVDIPDVSFGEFILNRCNEFKDLCALVSVFLLMLLCDFCFIFYYAVECKMLILCF